MSALKSLPLLCRIAKFLIPKLFEEKPMPVMGNRWYRSWLCGTVESRGDLENKLTWSDGLYLESNK